MGKLNSQKHISTIKDGVTELKVYEEADKIKIQSRDSLSRRCKGMSGAPNMSDVQTSRKSSESDIKHIERIKAKCSTSVKVNVKRKVLTDISNIRGNSSRTKSYNSSKLLVSNGKCPKNASNSARKFIMGNVRPNLNGATGDKQILTRDMKASFDGPKTRIQVRKSVTTGIRRTGRNALPPSRRSLPILQQVNVEDTNNKEKVNSKKLEKGKGISGVSVLAKPKAAGDVLPQLSNHSNIRRNRVGDASARMAPRGQAKVEVGALRRKSVRTVLKITASSLNSQKCSKSNSMSGVHKCTSRVSIPCKRLVDVRTSSLSKYATSEISAEQPHQKEVPSSSSGSLATPELSIARRKSDRRKSFTCLLMARSKLMKELCGNVELDNLSNIYDSCNHLEVTEYVDDIYQYYWVIEAQNQPIKNYMETQKEITPQMRGILINWLIEVHLKFDLMQETLFLMVTLLDYYLSLARVKKNDLQLVGLTSLLLASKYEDLFHPRVMDLLSISAESYTRDQMLEMEKDILRKLKFRLNAATPYVFMLRLLKAAQADTRFEHLAFYLIELCLVEYEALNYKPSMLCASAIYVARCTMQMTPAWTPLLGMHGRYQESQFRHCAEMILRFHKAASTALLKVTHEKYMQSSNSKVAAIKPLQSLP
ncbi:putative cyclin-B3-1 isoform X6 [Nicotiana tomentosiformis]|uniref:putative cyclin-B3-1 isoform X6 n=1 Tax=Nicotiana tomentosiformis TaxID=4098 RepID=UPI00051C834F